MVKPAYSCEVCQKVGLDRLEMENHEAIPVTGAILTVPAIYGMQNGWTSWANIVVVTEALSPNENHIRYYTSVPFFLHDNKAEFSIDGSGFLSACSTSLDEILRELTDEEFDGAMLGLNKKYEHNFKKHEHYYYFEIKNSKDPFYSEMQFLQEGLTTTLNLVKGVIRKHLE